MSGREWQPGTVAMVTVGDESPVLAFRDGDGALIGWSLADHRLGSIWVDCDRVTDVHPLVVIDPEDETAVERFVKACPEEWCFAEDAGTLGQVVEQMQAALREFANPTPPRPEEPTGLGAVVEDRDGIRWVRSLRADVEFSTPWRDCNDDHFARHYDAIAAVRVLSEGVTQ